MSNRAMYIFIVLIFASLCLSTVTGAVGRAEFYQYGSGISLTGSGNNLGTMNLGISISNIYNFHPIVATRYQIFDRRLFIYGSSTGTVCFDSLDIPRSGAVSGTLYIEVTTNAELLQRAQNDINAVYVDAFPSPPTRLIIETIIDIRPSSSASGDDTTFQLIIATNGVSTFGIVLVESVASTVTQSSGIGSSSQIVSSCTTSIITFPFESDVSQAPNMRLNTYTDGKYVFQLGGTADVPLVPPPPCECNKKIIAMACHYLKQNKGSAPAGPCN